MAHRGSRLVRPLAVLVAMGALWASFGADMARRWRTGDPLGFLRGSAGASDGTDEPMAEDGPSGRAGRRRPIMPAVAADRRLAPLRRAARSWRRADGPPRAVVDQVCLVPDVPSFLDAIAAWDDRHFFPILIDEPAWTLPFLRAFRPARVVRHAAHADRRALPGPPDPWAAALEAVARGWLPPAREDESLRSAGAPPRGLGRTPPGVVLSSPDSPMLAGAVALAAGRFQPLLRLEPNLGDLDGPGAGGRVRYGDVLTLPQAWRFARQVEARVAVAAPRYDQLGDDCDFLTIAGDWPYRYDNQAERAPARGIQCLDDLIGRVLVGGPDAQGLGASRRRWAFTGRLLGDPAASVARAMAALFLAPADVLIWDTYPRGTSHAEYTAGPAANVLARSRLVPGAIAYAVGRGGASLANWHRIMEGSNRFGLIWINSSGGPDDFAIDGGPGRPADLPGGLPAAVVMIHSFSAADPADPRTLAGRWLLQGAFVYFGSLNEPFLIAFRKPGLVAELAAEGVPLSAALRQGEAEPLGRPWRLIFLGDPLYRIPASGPVRMSLPSDEGRQPARDEDSGWKREDSRRRADPDSWRQRSPAPVDWGGVEVMTLAGGLEADGSGPPADRRLAWCRDAAIVELAGGGSAGRRGPDWRAALRRIGREELDPRLRPDLDELLIDAMGQAGEWDELQSRLSRIPTGERRPRVWAALETAAVIRLARAARDPDRARGLARVRELLEEVRHLQWPAGSGFPGQFEARAAHQKGARG